MSGVAVGRRRNRRVIARLSLPGVSATGRASDGPPDTSTDRSLLQIEDTVNEILDVIEGNIDLGNLDP